MPSIVFIGTPDFAGEILAFIAREKLAHVKAAWTRPSKPRGRGQKIEPGLFLSTCLCYGIPCHETEDISSEENVHLLRSLDVDLAIVVAFGEIIKPAFYEMPRYKTYNLHFSLLPKYRGASPIQTAIIHGERQSGITLQRINARMDEGDVALKRRFSIHGLSAKEVLRKSTEESFALFKEFLETYQILSQKLTPQDHEKASYCQKIHKEAGWIRPHTSFERVKRMLLAYDPWPGVYFSIGRKRYQVIRVSDYSEGMESEPGTLASLGRNFLCLHLKGGSARIDRLKPEGKREMDANSFLNGFRMKLPVVID